MIGNSLRLAGILIVIAIAGPLVWSVFLKQNHDFVISITAFAIGVVTFFGITDMNRSGQDQNILKGENLRTAIACSLIISYLFIVCFTAFVKTAEVTGGVTQYFVNSFSNVIGITIAFYFGASAAAQIFTKDKQDAYEKDSTKKE